jgi:alkylation response protein AidB-like acyl-CoA dehydrogenase
MRVEINEEQQLLKSTFERLFQAKSTPARIRACEPLGHDPELWTELVGMGIPLMRVAAEKGGLNLSLLSAALIAEEAGRYAASAPLLESIVGTRLLAQVAGGDTPDLLDRVVNGTAIVSIALVPADEAPIQLVPAGAVADAVIALRGDALILVVSGRKDHVPNTGKLPLARWDLSEGRVLSAGDDAAAHYQAAIEEWRLLAAAMLVGAADQALRLASDYANERHQFGRPIGSFQGVAHPLADSLSEIDAGRITIWKAITRIANHGDDASGLAALAYWWSTQAGNRAVHRALRTLGGYGLSLEYDVQLYHRRVIGQILSGGDPQKVLRAAGDRLFGGSRVAMPDAGEATMSFELPERSQRMAAELSRFFDDNFTPQMKAKAHHSTSSHDRDFHRKLAQRKFFFKAWKGADPSPAPASDGFAIAAVMEERGYTTHLISTTDMVGQMVERLGAPELQAEVLPRILGGEAVCSLGFSEPGAGSDVFSAVTRAARDGENWLINGQKMFTTGAHYADYVLLLARTDSSGKKHEGLTLFLVPTDLPGFSFQAVRTYQDERTNISFYTDIRLPDRYRISGVGEGASAMGVALTLEHSAAGAMFHGQHEMMKAARVWGQTQVGGKAPFDSADIRIRFAAVMARFEAAHSLVARSLWAADTNRHHRAWGPMAKMFVTEAHLSNAWELLQMGAPESGLTSKDPLGVVELGHRRAYGSTIYGGTSEIHRSLVAEQGLGLPKSRS